MKISKNNNRITIEIQWNDNKNTITGLLTLPDNEVVAGCPIVNNNEMQQKRHARGLNIAEKMELESGFIFLKEFLCNNPQK